MLFRSINIVNNKFYVGSAVNLNRRKTRHFSELRNGKHPNKHLQAAWLKYGEKSFIFVVVEELKEGDDLLETENKWLKLHVGKDYCYNLGVDATAPTLGWSGEKSPTWGYKHSPEARAKIGASSRVRVQSEEEKAKRSASMKGRILPTEVREKISRSLSGKNNFWYGKKRPYHGAKVSRAVVVINPDGVSTEYASIATLREALSVKPPTVNRALKSQKPISRGPLTGWSIKYVDAHPQKA